MKHLYQHAAKFLHWWVSELVAAGRLGTTRVLPHWKRDLTAFVSRDSVSLIESSAGSDEPLLQFPRPDSSSHAPPPVTDGVIGASLQQRRVRIIVDPDLAFVRRLKLPLAAMPHLASAVRLQIPKLLPLQADRLRSDFRVVNVDAAAASVEVELAAIRCSDIESLQAALQHWKLDPYAIQLGKRGERPFRFNFGSSNSGLRSVSVARVDGVLMVSAGLLSLALVLTFATQTWLAQRSLQQALQQSSAEAAQILGQRQSLIASLETLSALSTAERSPSAASVLSEVTQRMGHESWVMNFDLDGDKVQLSGRAPDSGAVVTALSSSKLLMQVQLRSSQAEGTKAKGERFEITARVGPST